MGMDEDLEGLSYKDWANLKRDIDAGVERFWNDPEKPWRQLDRKRIDGLDWFDWVFGDARTKHRASGGKEVLGEIPEEHGEHPSG